MLTVTECARGSISSELGIKAGDKILEFNGIPCRDILDYVYYDGQEEFTILVDSNGEITEYEIEKDYSETLGLSFKQQLVTRSCRNKCIFCFVDQCAPNMRKTLYVKDDDWRLSFVSGNYVTLTNLRAGELERIIEQGFSPLYVSVHATDRALRERILGCGNADIMPYLHRLSDSGIRLHTQIVLVEGVNDGDALRESLADLAPIVDTVAVVPVGLTKYSKAGLKPLSADCANKTISLIESVQAQCLSKYGTRKVFAADELYILANAELPPYDSYEDFWQIENGVGMWAKLSTEFSEALSGYNSILPQTARTLSIATGVAAMPLLKRLVDKLKGRVSVNIYAIKNEFFGESVTVAGLITGGDIIKQLGGKPLGEKLLITKSMLREFTDVFLDGISVAELSAKLSVPVQAIENDGESLLRALME